MQSSLNPTFLKFLTRFILIVLLGVTGAVVAGHLKSEKPETAATYTNNATYGD